MVSERPLEIHMTNGQLHNEDGPAFLSRDGWKMWFLNGVEVPEEIVITPASKLDPQTVVKTENAEVRREIVRKIGIERVVKGLQGKVLDTYGKTYQLITLNLGDGRNRPYLKMRNPSINTWHIEGVPSEVETVKQALAWRNQTEEEPMVLT